MKIAPAAAAACLLALAGCAGTQPLLSTQPTQSAGNTAGGTYYCWRDKLFDDGSNLVCNWEPSVMDACDSHARVSLAKSNVSGTPQNSRRCENGQWLVTVKSN